MLRIPMRHNRSARSSRPGADRLGSVASCRIDRAARKAASPPGSTMQPGAGGEHRGGQLVGDADLTLRARRGDRVDEPLRGRLLRPEVAGRAAHRQHQQARPQHLRAWHDLVDRRRHAFEVPGIAAGIGGGDVDVRAARLSLPATQTPSHPGRTSRRRTRDDAIGQCDHDGIGRGQTRRGSRRHRGPVHAPDGQHSARHVIRPLLERDRRSDRRPWSPAAPD